VSAVVLEKGLKEEVMGLNSVGVEIAKEMDFLGMGLEVDWMGLNFLGVGVETERIG
jgi:hypothetical protein